MSGFQHEGDFVHLKIRFNDLQSPLHVWAFQQVPSYCDELRPILHTNPIQYQYYMYDVCHLIFRNSPRLAFCVIVTFDVDEMTSLFSRSRLEATKNLRRSVHWPGILVFCEPGYFDEKFETPQILPRHCTLHPPLKRSFFSIHPNSWVSTTGEITS